MPAPGSLPGSGEDRKVDTGDRVLRTLRARWRTASLAAGWRFPSDWGLPEVDAVCAAVVREDRAEQALAGLGRARAAAGAGLTETLTDLAALHAVLDQPDGADGFVAADVDSIPARLIRVTAVAWADVAMDKLAGAEVTDPLTGLPNHAYLRTRLAEVYAEAAAADRSVADDHTLLVVSMDFSQVSGWPRLTGMIMVADAVREVFRSGESVASIGPSAVAVLARRSGKVAGRGVLLRRALTDRLAVDAQLHEVAHPRIRVLRLPGDHAAACALVDDVRRS
ncbi:GGDEF domain-containing protein [Amycolatopsis suaedae]|uniref:GGDEF domain-containing protein n=2 Tax=Amycolatopsis suaedae TaxID=2510978 RepID=A0A4Q7J6G5_9PSEU|nr:GGDEF domain-containing protein [Amycolatopsis suaedae]RZQ62729.1 GGDEF domain-containing protein [Amycolatopsis suaedae]